MRQKAIRRHMATIGERITEKAIEILDSKPEGIRYADLVRAISETDNSFKTNTIHGTVWNLEQHLDDQVYKPSRGLFRLTKFRDPETDQFKDELASKQPMKLKEEDFYEPFADWLQNDIEEVTKAMALGGNRFRDKWGTPDVIGKRESKRIDINQAPVEIASAEIKPDVSQLVTAFGQACASYLFSHKSYLVVSGQAPQDEIARLDSLCHVFGIGLVLFDLRNPTTPDFNLRVRPRKQEPDFCYANKYMALIESEMFA